eukprot:447192-Amorphochlora_amoeboformis.AAC.1
MFKNVDALSSSHYCRYHGDPKQGARAYATRYDRVYQQGKDMSLMSFELVGEETVVIPNHHLSDHFGVFVEWNMLSQ